MAADVVRFVGMERGDMALLRAGDLLSQTSYCLKRWEGRIPHESRLNLIGARRELVSICAVLTDTALEQMTRQAKSNVVSSCQRVSMIFYEESGAAVKAADEVN